MEWYDPSVISQYKRTNDFEANTNISLRNRYVYLAVDKAANSTIKERLYRIEYEPTNWDIVTLYDKRSSPLLSPHQLPPDLLRQVFTSGDYYRFTLVRNPFTRLLSCYLDRIRRQTSRPRRQLNANLKRRGTDPASVDFYTFVQAICEQGSAQQNSHWRVQSDDILFDRVDFDYVGKFENLAQEMSRFSQAIWGVQRDEMDIVGPRDTNSSPQVTNAGSRLRDYYTPELVDLVQERYRADFKNFEYPLELPEAPDP